MYSYVLYRLKLTNEMLAQKNMRKKKTGLLVDKFL